MRFLNIKKNAFTYELIISLFYWIWIAAIYIPIYLGYVKYTENAGFLLIFLHAIISSVVFSLILVFIHRYIIFLYNLEIKIEGSNPNWELNDIIGALFLFLIVYCVTFYAPFTYIVNYINNPLNVFLFTFFTSLIFVVFRRLMAYLNYSKDSEYPDVQKDINIKSMKSSSGREKVNESVITDYYRIEERVYKEITSLNNKANINLIIGVFTSVGAVIFLIISSVYLAKSYDNWFAFLTFFIPRFTLIVFIEVFSFYFLTLYRNNLNEIKYYQNEMTNIEFKKIATKMALNEYDEHLKDIISELLKTERNAILKDNEKTVELEKAKIENELHKSFLEKITPNIDWNIFKPQDSSKPKQN